MRVWNLLLPQGYFYLGDENEDECMVRVCIGPCRRLGGLQHDARRRRRHRARRREDTRTSQVIVASTALSIVAAQDHPGPTSIVVPQRSGVAAPSTIAPSR